MLRTGKGCTNEINRLILLIWTVLWSQTWSQEPSRCTRHPQKWPWKTDASGYLDIPRNLPWGICRLLHSGQNPSFLSKRSGGDSAKGCSWIHPLRVSPVGFCTKGMDQEAAFIEIPLVWLRAGTNLPAVPFCELHHYCAVQYLLLIWSGEQCHVINRGMNCLSFIPLPCLWTKKKLTCLVLALQKL